MVIHGPALTSASFAAVLDAALRTVIDDLSCPCFNVAVQPMWEGRQSPTSAQQPFEHSRVIARSPSFPVNNCPEESLVYEYASLTCMIAV